MNFYMKKECKCCGVIKETHLGKSSAGWSFSFKGDRDEGVKDFASWQARVEKLLADGYKLTDEGDSDIPLQDLLGSIMRKKSFGSQYTEPYDGDRRDWVDPDGNDFTDCEFS